MPPWPAEPVEGTARPHTHRVPWPITLTGKLVLSRLPVSSARWRALGVFRHGDMDDAAYAARVFDRHVGRVGPLEPGWVGCELGPGDSAFSAVLAAAHGAGRTYLVDSAAVPLQDPRPYIDLARHLGALGLPAPDLDGCGSLEEVLDRCHATYSSAGAAALATIDDATIDVCWSHAVLEHARVAEVDGLLGELARVTAPTGVHSHRIDLRDHFAGSLQNLRFSARVWESALMANSGFYTNRLRYGQLLEALARAGFSVQVVRVDRWAELPIRRRRLAAPFRTLPDEELRVAGFDVILTRGG